MENKKQSKIIIFLYKNYIKKKKGCIIHALKITLTFYNIIFLIHSLLNSLIYTISIQILSTIFLGHSIDAMQGQKLFPIMYLLTSSVNIAAESRWAKPTCSFFFFFLVVILALANIELIKVTRDYCSLRERERERERERGQRRVEFTWEGEVKRS